MKPNFHAIEAIAYGLGYGVKGLPTFFRLGWLPTLLLFGIALYLTSQGTDFNFGGSETSTSVRVDGDGSVGQFGIQSGRSFEINPEEWTAPIIASAFGAIFALFLMIPAFVAMTREAAGVEVRSGFLPAFGGPEIAYVAAAILSILIYLLFGAVAVIAIALPMGLTGALLEGQLSEDAIGPLAVILILLFVVALIWFAIRFSLFVNHAAVTGRIAPVEAFKMTGGRFWKLFGAYILLAIIVGIIGFGIEMVGLAFSAFNMIWLPLLISLTSQLYQTVAQTGFAGRVVRDLLATRDYTEQELA
jgi:hypothetical protein